MNTKIKTLLKLVLLGLISIGFVDCVKESTRNYTITFITDTQERSEVESIQVAEGAKVTKPTDPTRVGNEFLEWQLDGKRYDFSTPVKKDITLVAVWKNQKITFDTQGGDEISDTILIYGKLLIKPKDPIKEGNEFLEWQLDGKRYDFSTPVKKDITLIAVWKQKYTITFDTQGGDKISDTILIYGKLLIKPKDPIKEGNEFLEWQLDGKRYDFSTPVKKDITLIAVWKNQKHTIIFDTKGADKISDIIVTYGDLLPKPKDPTKAGYEFIEWQLDGETYNFLTPVKKDITLVAVWKQKYTITFDTKGADKISETIVIYGELLLKPIEPTKANHRFVEWQLDGETYDFSSPVKKNINLTAIWALEGIIGDWEVKEIDGNIILVSYKGTDTEVEIPENIYGKNVVSIGGNLFGQSGSNLNNSIISIDMSKAIHLKTIGNGAFTACSSLNSINIPNSVTSIGEKAFEDCSSLTTVTIERKETPITTIKSKSFLNTPILSGDNNSKIIYPVGAEYYLDPEWAKLKAKWEDAEGVSPTYNENWRYVNIEGGIELTLYTGTDTEIIIPESVDGKNIVKIRRYLLGQNDGTPNTTITSVDMSNAIHLKTINGGVFENCTALTSVTIPNSVTSIGESAFEDCSSLESITIPNSVISIGANTFNECRALNSITIPNSVTSIGISAFLLCRALKSINIPNSVTSIGRHAFFFLV